MTKKLILSCLFLCLIQSATCKKPTDGQKLNQCTLANGVDVVLHEDFRMPVTVVGIIFDVGLFSSPAGKYGIVDITASNIISKESAERLRALGVSWDTNACGEYTEILARVNPKYINQFFQIICNDISNFSVRDIEAMKKQLIIDNKLRHYCFENVISNAIFSNINPNAIFNEKALRSISSYDVKNFYNDNYKTNHISIIVVGAIGYKNLIKVLQTTVSNLPPRKNKVVSDCKNTEYKHIHIESKFIGAAVNYFYKLPKENSDVFFKIFNYEVFKFFEKNNKLITDYECNDITLHGDNIKEIYLRPRNDVSLKQLQTHYNAFIDYLTKKEYPKESIAKIATINNYTNQFLLSDLEQTYEQIRNACLSEKNPNHFYNMDDRIKEISPDVLRSFAKKILKSNLILKITTQHRTDK